MDRNFNIVETFYKFWKLSYSDVSKDKVEPERVKLPLVELKPLIKNVTQLLIDPTNNYNVNLMQEVKYIYERNERSGNFQITFYEENETKTNRNAKSSQNDMQRILIKNVILRFCLS